MDAPTWHEFGTGALRARVAAHGAELVSVKTADGAEILWQAGPAWPRHSPVLFPIVGRLADDQARFDGTPYRITQHGFARDQDFTWHDRTPEGCTLVLSDTDATRALFPKAFVLFIDYRITGNRLTVRYRLENPSATESLAASLGAHPAFAWPLDGRDKSGHSLTFAEPQAPEIRRVKDGLMLAESVPSPVQGTRLDLHDDLFINDALIFEAVRGTELVYAHQGGRLMRFSWSGFPQLGVWMKPGADFMCIEPWHGYASPVGFDGDFQDKPGLIHLPPGAHWSGHWQIELP